MLSRAEKAKKTTPTPTAKLLVDDDEQVDDAIDAAKPEEEDVDEGIQKDVDDVSQLIIDKVRPSEKRGFSVTCKILREF